jgi:hypothetical protein
MATQFALTQRAQRGVATMLLALFLLVATALMVQVVLSSSRSSVVDSATQIDNVRAQFLAESVQETALSAYLAGRACGNLPSTTTAYYQPTGSVSVTTPATDFAGNALGLGPGQCYVEATATLGTANTASSTARTVGRVIFVVGKGNGNMFAGGNWNTP